MKRKKWNSWDEFVRTRSSIQLPYVRLLEAGTQCRIKTEVPGWVCFRDVPHYLPDNADIGSKRLWMVAKAALGSIEKMHSYGAQRYRVKHMAQGDAQQQQPIALPPANPDTFLDWDPELPFADAEFAESGDTWPWDKTARRSRDGLVVVDYLKRKRQEKHAGQLEQQPHDWQNVPNERHPDGRHKLDFVWIGGGLADLHERLQALEKLAQQNDAFVQRVVDSALEGVHAELKRQQSLTVQARDQVNACHTLLQHILANQERDHKLLEQLCKGLGIQTVKEV